MKERIFKNIFYGKSVDSMEQEISTGTSFSFSAAVWKQFKKNKPALWSLRFVILLVVIALLAPFLANDKPLYCVYKGCTLYPALSSKQQYEIKTPDTAESINLSNGDWKKREYTSVVWPLLSVYSPGKSDLDNAGEIGPASKQSFTDSKGNTIEMPTRFRHWLGVSKDGSDVLSGLIHGIKYALLIGILSFLIAGIIGISLGALAGFYGDNKLKTSVAGILITFLGIFLGWFYAFSIRWTLIKDSFSESGLAGSLQLILSISIFIFCMYLFRKIASLIERRLKLTRTIYVPVDSLVCRAIEVLNSMPIFVLIISIGAIVSPSFITLVIIIGGVSWTPLARLTRAEFLRVRSLDFMTAGTALGYSDRRLILRHALPNALGPALVAISFGIAGSILTESSLSFLNVGVPAETVTWGKLISGARSSITSWWLIVFPGSAIFLTVLAYNLIGEGLRDALDPRHHTNAVATNK